MGFGSRTSEGGGLDMKRRTTGKGGGGGNPPPVKPSSPIPVPAHIVIERLPDGPKQPVTKDLFYDRYNKNKVSKYVIVKSFDRD